MRYYGPSPPSERSQCVIIDVYSEGERPDCISITSLSVPRVLGSDVGRFVFVSRSSVCYLELHYPPCTSAAESEQRLTFRDEIIGQIPFDLIRMDATLPSVETYISEAECTKNNHYDTLEKCESDLFSW